VTVLLAKTPPPPDAAPLYLQYYDDILFMDGHFQFVWPAQECTISQIAVK
jgi:hypothetical protein